MQNLRSLYWNAQSVDPMGEDFEYVAEFQTLNLEEVRG